MGNNIRSSSRPKVSIPMPPPDDGRSPSSVDRGLGRDDRTPRPCAGPDIAVMGTVEVMLRTAAK